MMASEGNNIQTLFFISNSFNGFGFGLFLFAFGVGRGVVGGGVTGGYATCAAVGAALLGVALLGYCGAITMNRKLLDTYSVVMLGCAVYQIVHLAVLSGGGPLDSHGRANDLNLNAFFVTMICITVITLVSVLLSCSLSIRIRAATNRSHQLTHLHK